jgi:hypothetical protein
MPKEVKLFKKNKSDNTKCQNLPDLSELSEIKEKVAESVPEQFENKSEESDLKIDEESAEKKLQPTEVKSTKLAVYPSWS